MLGRWDQVGNSRTVQMGVHAVKERWSSLKLYLDDTMPAMLILLVVASLGSVIIHKAYTAMVANDELTQAELSSISNSCVRESMLVELKKGAVATHRMLISTEAACAEKAKAAAQVLALETGNGKTH